MKPRYKIVKIEWQDSCQPVCEWQWLNKYPEPTITKCVSVGFLIAETKYAVAIALSIADINTDHAQTNGVMRIPRISITKITRIIF